MDTNYAARGGRTEPTRDAALSRGMVWVLQAGFVLAVALQVYVLYLYTPDPSQAVSIPHADKVVHAVVFAVPAAVGVLARLRPWLVGLVLAVHAPVSELVQYLWLPARSGELGDIVADWVGVALGLAIGSILGRRLSR
ncbi:MAG: VanZ family protein [Dermatophilaceae bacterium]|nr:VanZ family protein [Intrasporangiaceae bacterium]